MIWKIRQLSLIILKWVYTINHEKDKNKTKLSLIGNMDVFSNFMTVLEEFLLFKLLKLLFITHLFPYPIQLIFTRNQ